MQYHYQTVNFVTTSTLSLLGKPERYDGLNDERVGSDDQT